MVGETVLGHFQWPKLLRIWVYFSLFVSKMKKEEPNMLLCLLIWGISWWSRAEGSRGWNGWVSVYYSLFVSKTKKILRNCESEKCIFLELDASCGNKTRNDSTWLTWQCGVSDRWKRKCGAIQCPLNPLPAVQGSFWLCSSNKCGGRGVQLLLALVRKSAPWNACIGCYFSLMDTKQKW